MLSTLAPDFIIKPPLITQLHAIISIFAKINRFELSFVFSMKNPLVKVCCITSLTEAKLALDTGADMLGLVSEMPSGPGVISLKRIGEITRALSPETRTVLLTSKLKCHEILDQHKAVQTWGIQLVDQLPVGELIMLRKMLPGTPLIQVIHVQGKASISQVLTYENMVDFILLDSGNPGAVQRKLGGTGKTHDWHISREICQQSRLPVFLAGGLNPDNIIDANIAVHPSGFDVCSGVRTQGYLDLNKLNKFIQLIRDQKEI